MLARGYGFANLEASIPATPGTAYHLASITKVFTAVSILMLVEDGKLSLDDPISRHISDLPMPWRPITLRHLLTHTSGISSFSAQKTIRCPVGKREEDYERHDALREVACLPLEFTPGERWAYGDTGYHLLGMTVEKVGGMTFAEFLTSRIFKPLGMTATRLHTATHREPRAVGYSRTGARHRPAGDLPAFEFANAGLVSTVLDMTRFDLALNSDRLLKQTTLQTMWTNARLNSGEKVTAYGLGFGLTPFRGQRRVAHSGGGGFGFATAFTRFPDLGVTVVILSNTDQEGFVISDLASEVASVYFPRDL